MQPVLFIPAASYWAYLQFLLNKSRALSTQSAQLPSLTTPTPPLPPSTTPLSPLSTPLPLSLPGVEIEPEVKSDEKLFTPVLESTRLSTRKRKTSESISDTERTIKKCKKETKMDEKKLCILYWPGRGMQYPKKLTVEMSQKKESIENPFSSRGRKLRFSCPECDKCFEAFKHLERHFRIHTGETPFVCSKCNRAFTDEANCARHLETHTTVFRFSCKRCQTSFKYKRSLTRHEKRENC